RVVKIVETLRIVVSGDYSAEAERCAMTMQTETSDKGVLDFMRRQGAVTIGALVAEMGVTATAVRQRLQRLMADGKIQRQTERKGRGRANDRYSLTEKGERAAGTTCANMAT